MKLSSTALYAIALAFCRSLNFVEARGRPGIRMPSPRNNLCSSFYDSTFCALARNVSEPGQCDTLSSISKVVCPSQFEVCTPGLNVTAYCSYNYGCIEECMNYMNTCCETQCCETSCLDEEVLCMLLDVGTCPEAKAEICPCKSDNRTDVEYCSDLIGDNAECVEKCLDFISTCCDLKDGDLRLTQTSTESTIDGKAIEGRLEVFYQGEWGTVCDNRFGPNEAKVACRQLGYYEKGAQDNTDLPGRDEGTPTWMDFVECTGSETRLADCDFTGLKQIDCYRYEDVGVQCLLEPPNAAQGELRLLSNRTEGNYVRGTLQIFHSGVWGSLCFTNRDSFGQEEAAVACRQLGYSDKASFWDEQYSNHGGPYATTMDCEGTEDRVMDCQFPGLQSDTCGDVAEIVCLIEEETGTEGDLRMYENTTNKKENYASGDLQVYHDGAWGRVCAQGFGSNDASVACRQLGFYDKGAIWSTDYVSNGEVPVAWINELDCTGNETKLVDCPFRGYYPDCDDDVSVRCALEPENGTIGELRLNVTNDDESTISGRLEIFNGIWGSVCDRGFDKVDADVACRQLGYFDEGAFALSNIPSGSRPIWMKEPECSGDEERLVECPFPGFGEVQYCDPYDSVGVRCLKENPTNTTYGELRLAQSTESDGMISGRLEVNINDYWGTICDDGFDLIDAQVACHQLGYKRIGAQHFNCVDDPRCETRSAARQVWMSDLECKGTEEKLYLCDHELPDTGGSFFCSSRDDIGLSCAI